MLTHTSSWRFSSLLLVLAGVALTASCSGGGGGDDDDDDARDPVQVVVRDYSDASVAGVPVLVSDSSGAIVEFTVTGSSGVAVVVPAGGSVAAFVVSGLSYYVDGVIDPPPGVTFEAREPSGFPATPTPVPTVALSTYTVDPMSVPGGATSVEVYLCNASATLTPPNPVDITNSTCREPGTMDLYAIALNGATPVGWIKQTVTSGTDATVSSPISASTLSPHTTTLQSVPQTADFTRLNTYFTAGKTRFDGVFIDSTTDISSTLSFPPDEVTFMTDYAIVTVPSGIGFAHINFTRNSTSLTPSTLFDATSVPYVFLDPPDVSDIPRPSLVWDVTGSGYRGEYGFVQLYLETAVAFTSVRYLFDPTSTRTTWRLPEYPAELLEWTPSATNVLTGAEAGFLDTDAADYLSALADAGRGTLIYQGVDASVTEIRGYSPPAP